MHGQKGTLRLGKLLCHQLMFCSFLSVHTWCKLQIYPPPLPHSRVLVLLATKQEWGNPNEHKFHEYMLSYSPYDNVRQQPYPAMLVTGGLNDPRVSYVALSSTCFGMRIFIYLFLFI